jgi:dipeptidyl-peptidase-4
MYAKFAPDGNSVAYVRDGNLYLEDLLDGSVRQLTTRPNDRILNGMSDWVYEEEFGLRDAFQWSPNGMQIAYWRFDTSGVQDFTLINNTDSIYPTTKTFAYPKAGTRNSDVRVAVMDLATGATQFIEMSGDPRNHYIPRMQWIEKTGELLVRQMNRLQNRETLTLVNFDSGTKRVIHTEKDDAWIDLQDSIEFTEDAESFLYMSDRDGWQHVYRKDVSTDKLSPLTTGSYDVVELLKVLPGESAAETRVYFIASPDSATERFLFSSVDGQVSRITPQGLPGVHRYEISPCGGFAIHRFSTTERPTVTELISLPSHNVLRVLESNKALVDTLDGLDPIATEFFQIKLDETFLDAWCMNPPGMESGKKSPLLVHVYGEPAGSTVMNRWGGKTALWHRMMAEHGCIVISIDNRGTKAPRGREFRKAVYRRLGSLGPDDQAAALKQLLKERDDIDPDRIGIWGWSGGGTSTLHGVFRYSDLYRTGVAVAPVANLSYYDTIYEERYMGLPATNVDGYRNGSAIHFADGLKGDLLLIHGTADDNVHYQATELLINELIERGKLFEMFLYPGRSHSINEGKNTRKHVMSVVTRFLDRTLLTP